MNNESEYQKLVDGAESLCKSLEDGRITKNGHDATVSMPGAIFKKIRDQAKENERGATYLQELYYGEK